MPTQFRAGMHLLGSLQALIALLLIAGLCVRSSFSTTFSAYTPGVLEGLSVGLILLAPSAIPALASLTEALCTAHVLSYLEAAVVRAKWKLKLVVRVYHRSPTCLIRRLWLSAAALPSVVVYSFVLVL